jgi:hypothetical protein
VDLRSALPHNWHELTALEITGDKDSVIPRLPQAVCVKISGGIGAINAGTFDGTDVRFIAFGKDSNVNYIGGGAFWDCNLQKMHIPASVKEIKDGAFGGAKVEYLDLSEYSEFENLPPEAQHAKALRMFKRKEFLGHEVVFPQSNGSVVRFPGGEELVLTVEDVENAGWREEEAAPEPVALEIPDA